jgi:hypothetical protein
MVIFSEYSEKSGYTATSMPVQPPYLPRLSQPASTSSPPENDYSKTFGLIAPIVDFVGELSNEPKYIEHSLSKLLRGLIPSPSPGTKFRWIHVPMNHMGWAEVNAKKGTDHGLTSMLILGLDRCKACP